MPATNKSVSFNDDLIWDIQRKMKDEGMDFSKVVNEMVRKGLNGNAEGQKDDIPSLNKKILMLNNNILLLYIQYDTLIAERIKQKEEELLNTEQLKKKEIDEREDKIFKYEARFIELGILDRVKKVKKKVDIDDPDSYYSLKKECPEISAGEVFDYLTLKEVAENGKRGGFGQN